MRAPRRLSESVIIVLIAAGAVIRPNPSFAQEQTPTTTARTDTSPVRKLGRMDVRHPLHVGSDYYPQRHTGRQLVRFQRGLGH